MQNSTQASKKRPVGLVPTLHPIQWLRGIIRRGKAVGSRSQHSPYLVSNLRAIPQLPQVHRGSSTALLCNSTGFSNYDAANMEQRAALHSLSPYMASYNENKVVYK